MSEKHPLVLVPGLLCTADLWRDQIDALADIADITVAEHWLDDRIPAIATRVLEAAPPRFALAGLSMGGYISLEIVRQAPERVTHLALLDTSSRMDTPEQRQRRIDFLHLAERGKFKGVTRHLLPVLIHESRLHDDDLTARIYKMSEDIGVEGFLRQERAILERIDSRPSLAAIKCPTLVLCGRQDALTPLALHEEMAGAIADSELVVIEECGHLSTMERPGEVTAALRRWLVR